MEYIALQPQFIVFPIIALLMIALTVFLVILGLDDEIWFIGAFLGFLATVALVWATIAMFVPFNSQYYGVYSVTGTVEKVSTSIDVGGKYVTNDYVVQLEGDPNLYVLRDPRIIAYEGQELDLICTIGWVPYSNTDRFSCKIG